MMKIEEINNLLAKKVTGEASPSEHAILEQWKALSIENENIYNEYALLWNAASDFEPTNFNPDFENALESHLNIISSAESKVIPLENIAPTREYSTSKASVFSIKRISSIAAIFVLGVAAMFLLRNSSTTITSEGGVQYVSLNDGSAIWLDEGSSITYKKGFGENHRNVSLKGKAFFDVNRNENLPFHISEEDFNVSVLGTSFTVDGANDQVAVTSGEVAVKIDEKKVILTKNEMASVKSHNIETSSTTADSQKWRNANLSFDNASLSQVIADVNMYHNNQLIIDEKSTTGECSFTSGGLKNESFENIILILQKSFDLTVTEKDNGKVSLLISDCL